MKTMYNQASLDYRRVLMPQQQFQAALNKGMPPQQAMKAAYPGAGGGGGGAPTAQRGVPQAAQGGAIEQIKSEARRLVERAKHLGGEAVSEVQKIISAGAAQPGGQLPGTPRGRVAGPPQLAGGRPGMGGVAGMGGAPGIPKPPMGGPPGGGMPGAGMPPRRPPGMI